MIYSPTRKQNTAHRPGLPAGAHRPLSPSSSHPLSRVFTRTFSRGESESPRGESIEPPPPRRTFAIAPAGLVDARLRIYARFHEPPATERRNFEFYRELGFWVNASFVMRAPTTPRGGDLPLAFSQDRVSASTWVASNAEPTIRRVCCGIYCG